MTKKKNNLVDKQEACTEDHSQQSPRTLSPGELLVEGNAEDLLKDKGKSDLGHG